MEKLGVGVSSLGVYILLALKISLNSSFILRKTKLEIADSGGL